MTRKEDILKAYIGELSRELNTMAAAAKDAREAATHEESKAENEYDTRGLESSYLAGAQAKRASELGEMVGQLQKMEMKKFDEETPIEPSALVTVSVDGEEEKTFFIIALPGGCELEVGGEKFYVLYMNSPVGKNLKGKIVGDDFELQVKDETKIYEVVSVR